MFKLPLNILYPILRLPRYLHTSPICQLKQIIEKKDGKTTVIKAEFLSSPREPFMIKNDPEKGNACPLCQLGIEVKHTDVLILSQFVRSDGCMLPRRITGLCGKQQKRISILVAMAHKSGLMCSLNPPNSKRDPSRRKDYKRYNTYFDESTIRVWPKS